LIIGDSLSNKVNKTGVKGMGRKEEKMGEGGNRFKKKGEFAAYKEIYRCS